jgi:N utilization substance protein B
MRASRNARHAAVMALFQLDLASDPDPELLRESLEEAPGSAQEREQGLDLAQRVWSVRDELDRLVAPLVEEWPLHRQPPIDRNVLRLGAWEMRFGGTPGAAAINEAVELAKAFGTEKSAGFVNGVLDRLWQGLRVAPPDAAAAAGPGA